MDNMLKKIIIPCNDGNNRELNIPDRHKILTLIGKCNFSIERIKEKLEADNYNLNESLASAEESLTRLAADIETAQTRIGEAETAIGEIQAGFEELMAGLEEMATELSNLLESMMASVEGHEERLAIVEDSVSQLTNEAPTQSQTSASVSNLSIMSEAEFINKALWGSTEPQLMYAVGGGSLYRGTHLALGSDVLDGLDFFAGRASGEVSAAVRFSEAGSSTAEVALNMNDDLDVDGSAGVNYQVPQGKSLAEFSLKGQKALASVSRMPSMEASVSGDGMFAGCSGLLSVDLWSMCSSKLTCMRDMFRGCSSLRTLDLSVLDTSIADTMDMTFSGCKGLLDVNLKGVDTSAVSDMNGMFWDCISLVSLDLREFKTGNLMTSAGMFGGCEKLREIKLGGWDLGRLDNADGMFSGCASLVRVTGEIVGLKVSLDLADCPLSNDSAMVFIDGLADMTGADEPPVLTFRTSTYAGLSEEQRGDVTTKGWTLRSAGSAEQPGDYGWTWWDSPEDSHAGPTPALDAQEESARIPATDPEQGSEIFLNE